MPGARGLLPAVLLAAAAGGCSDRASDRAPPPPPPPATLPRASSSLPADPPAAGESAGAAPAAASRTAPFDGATATGLPRLLLPVEGVRPAELRNTFAEGRPGHRHEAIDIMAPRGTKVFAVDDGTLVKLFTSVSGGLTIYQFDRTGTFAYYYAHLDRYVEGAKEGAPLRRGDVIGYVGVSGNAAAEAPHLHFAVFRLGPAKQWWKGEAVDPFDALH